MEVTQNVQVAFNPPGFLKNHAVLCFIQAFLMVLWAFGVDFTNA